MAKIVFFEDSLSENLKPLNYLHHTAKLKIGILRIHEKYNLLDDNPIYLSRNNALDKPSFNPDEIYLFINSCLIPNAEIIETLKSVSPDAPRYSNRRLVYSKCTFINFQKYSDDNLVESSTTSDLLNYSWDLLQYNADQIEFDLSLVADKYNQSNKVYKGINIEIHPSTVLDCSEGPIVISNEVKVSAFCYLKGPLFIGEKTEIKPHSYITNCSVHMNCRLSGEVSSSIIYDYTNKGHYGFLGHSILGEWCNLGAGTTNSNLKNTYGNIVIDLFGEKVQTNKIFLGLIMGDHSKSAIGTLFNTGTICGAFSNVFEDIKTQKYINSFSWGGNSLIKVELEKLLNTVPKYLKRRDISLSEKDIIQIKSLYDNIIDFEANL